MIVEQRIWKARAGAREALVALGKAECARLAIRCRMITPLTHPGNLVIFEYAFADLAEQARFWAGRATEPEALEYERRLAELVEREHRFELFKVLWDGAER